MPDTSVAGDRPGLAELLQANHGACRQRVLSRQQNPDRILEQGDDLEVVRSARGFEVVLEDDGRIQRPAGQLGESLVAVDEIVDDDQARVLLAQRALTQLGRPGALL